MSITAKQRIVKLHILETTDVHGGFFPWDFTTKRPMRGSLARVATYVENVRRNNPDGVILLENGDILQGQPINYYYNFEATDKENIAASCVNFLRYDAQTFGNHDIEPGHAVYDKWAKELQCPMLGANIYDTTTGQPYVKPYTILNRQGVKIAVIGMITPAIPSWLPEPIWSGLQFKDMVPEAKKWIKIVKEQEKPDLIIGLFHAGADGGITTETYSENPTMLVAQQVPGFDVILFGHDHMVNKSVIKNSEGKEVLLCNASNNAQNVADVEVTLTYNGKKLVDKNLQGNIVDVRDIAINEAYMKTFETEIEDVKKWTDRQIGIFENTISSHDSFFGPSAFTDLILNLQLSLTKADISIAAPLKMNAVINKGPLTVGDMFNLYKFENKLYVMNLTGEEIRKHLEMSYDLWVNTMTSPDDHIMKLDDRTRGSNEKAGFKNMTFNFDSAAGIDYIVDVTKPDGEKVKILQMSNGQPFDEKKMYKVALNSYRANGGGELLTRGAGIPHEELEKRTIYKSELDLRHYLMEEIQRLGTLNPQSNDNWRFVPEEWTKPAIARDRKIIYNE